MPRHTCPVCGGTGRALEQNVDYWVCDKCGEIVDYPTDENGLCGICAEEREWEEEAGEIQER